ncbi:MAG: bifunctional proline dehydrogenase/L-glutamate gamma-semialdehyde dehydrogenase [Alphaproteobacteria bacterium CG11_big_fil_rev_8_21_14_0_20_39_49]|nr:MAG: bifunctional proline dehydrogenase/L-glutamate gamma-semialdehyde dehydrogenase [Alphaproteobacteria bacterium CG11_big_fil_rev_8_21_14_0_20_39_49]
MDKKLGKLLFEVSSQAKCSEDKTVLKLKKIVKDKRGSFAPIKTAANSYIAHIRSNVDSIGIEAFFRQYGLDTDEGIAILSLCEALLRVPDSSTANALIYDKLQGVKWDEFEGKGNSKVMKASALGMKIVGKFLNREKPVKSAATPFIRSSIKQSMKLLGGHFVTGQDINDAISRAKKYEKKGYVMSYDMLGEAARSPEQAERYINKYKTAIEKIQNAVDLTQSRYKRPAISIKLSAFHPHFHYTNIEKVKAELLPKLKEVVMQALDAGMSITIDAEEYERLDLTLEIFTELLCDNDLKEAEGIGLAVQAYQRHAYAVIDYIEALAKHIGKQIPVRLVKGAYWDAEIKKSQIASHEDYPVFTHKEHTDISYLACAYKMLETEAHIYPQFATHNAVTIAEIEKAAKGKQFEFQLIHGMGGSIYDEVVKKYPCRVYAPVGSYKELLPYLIRRLLENSANSSFVKNVSDDKIAPNNLSSDIVEYKAEKNKIPLPSDIYEDRKNSKGLDTGNKADIEKFLSELDKFKSHKWLANSFIGNKEVSGQVQDVYSPYNNKDKVGKVSNIKQTQVLEAVEVSHKAFEKWNKTPVDQRAEILEKMADLLEKNSLEVISLCMREAGKTIADSIAELREAVDFCRYYAIQARKLLGEEVILQGPTGEKNVLSYTGRGVFVCISPWNFPLAIFLGQVSAALVTGNTVIAKPSEQTPLIAAYAVRLLREAGVPKGVINLLLGDGEAIGKKLLNDHRVEGVVFTGSNQTANIINNNLAARGGAIIPFIAETGGQNIMIVDSTALVEQTVDDIIQSAFMSAGQRCSALRVLYVQNDIADELLQVLSGAMQTLNIGSPQMLETDISSVIDIDAKKKLDTHIRSMKSKHKQVAKADIKSEIADAGYFVVPHVFEINSIADLKEEVFGPVLHVVRYSGKNLDNVIAEVNSTGYGLTLGIQSRIESRAEYIRQRVNVGNLYVNRNMIGATVGVQPFGGEGLSGTGPKAGGPNYLLRFVTEKTYTVNTTAIGGNRDLLV